MKLRMRTVFGILLGAACIFVSGCGTSQRSPMALTNPFFAMDTGTDRRNLSAAEQAQMLKDLGYDGIGYSGIDGIEHMLEELDKRGSM